MPLDSRTGAAFTVLARHGAPHHPASWETDLEQLLGAAFELEVERRESPAPVHSAPPWDDFVRAFAPLRELVSGSTRPAWRRSGGSSRRSRTATRPAILMRRRPREAALTAAVLPRDEAVDLLQRLLRLNTVNPPGNETLPAELLRDYLEAAGVEVELYARVPERANLVARLRGGDGPASTSSRTPTPSSPTRMSGRATRGRATSPTTTSGAAARST